ncbi:MAG: lamin tail domain-containing protein, partial [Phaeodactylibacter sp.]|nr:lamin tail domain-containing protein [Phaeodactylibacter sp.]
VTTSISGSGVITGGEFWRDVVAVQDVGDPGIFYFDAPVLGPDGTFFPAGVRRVADGVDTDLASDWAFSDFNNGSDNTPTAGTPMMPASPAGCQDLFISEYMEGSGDNKCIELYNPTGGSIDLSAGGYQLLFYFNGSSSAGTTINLGGSIGAGMTFTLCDDGTDFEGLELEADQESTAGFFNGNDPVELKADGTTLDVFGQIGNSSNFAKDKTYRRKSSVTSGDTNGSDPFSVSAEWDEFSQNTSTDFGSHTFDCCGDGGDGGDCGFTNVSLFNLECGTGINEDKAFFEASATVADGSGSYLMKNPETNISYGFFQGVANGTITGLGNASITGNTPGEVAKLVLLDQMNASCTTPVYYFRVPECVSCPTTEDIFISEFHYDNAGGDVNEFVEVAVSDDFEGDLSSIEVVLYNGNGGASYGMETLDNFSEGSNANGITYYYFDFSSIQNGSPDGIALECNGQIFQFLSYEGTFSVNEVESTNVGVTEGGGTPEAGSLQLIDGVWTETCQNTKGGANADVICCEDPTFECLDNSVLLTFGSYYLSEVDVVDIDNKENDITCPAITLDMISPSILDCDDLGQTVSVTVTVNTPEGTSSCTAHITVADESGILPEPWDASDVGIGENDFDYEVCNANNGEFTITSGGRNFPANSTTDNTGYISQELCGDGSITVKIESRQGGFPGIAIRETTGAGSKMVTMLTNLTGQIYWASRHETNGNRNLATFYRPFPQWLRLVRQGDYIIGYSSTTGGSFSFVNAAYVPMNACVEIGMVVFSVNNNPGTGVFSNVTVTGNFNEPLTQEVQDAIQGISLKRGAEARTGEAVTFDVPAAVTQTSTLFPNPTSGSLNVRFEQSVDEQTVIVVRNQFGQALKQQQVPSAAIQTQIDVADLPAGIYYLEVQGGAGLLETLRFSKQ